ncbi:MAG: hypothetical protein WC503_06045 [Candidatus Shapirobacteria bacterium]
MTKEFIGEAYLTMMFIEKEWINYVVESEKKEEENGKRPEKTRT